MTHHLDRIGEAIFRAAIAENRCGELLEAFFAGGSATIDNGRLCIFTADTIADALRDTDPGDDEVFA